MDQLLPSLLWIPLVGALICAFLGGRAARGVALLAALAHTAVALFAATRFDWTLTDNGLASVFLGLTFEPLGFAASLNVDPLSLLLVITTGLLSSLSILASFGRPAAAPTPASLRRTSSEGAYYAWLLVLLAALTGVWIARDLLLFYAFFELILVPLFFLIGTFGGADRRQAAAKIFIYTFTGSILALPAILYVGLKAGSFDLGNAIAFAQSARFSSNERFWVLMGLLASFCVKTPVFPLHTWQPSAMAESPGDGVVDASGLVLKLGAFAILKIALPIGLLNPDGSVAFPGTHAALAVLALIGILYGALCAWVQTDMKRVLAYSSLSHVGFVVLGIVALNRIGIQGAGLYLINTALTTGALFLVVGMIHRRYGTRDTGELSGLGRQMPLMAFFFGLFTMAAIGLPLLNGFVSEFLTILGAFTSRPLGLAFGHAHAGVVVGSVAALGIVLGAVYMLAMAAKVLFGPVRVPKANAVAPAHPVSPDLDLREVLTLAPLAALVILLGVFPTPVLNTLKLTADSVVRAPVSTTVAAPGTVTASAEAALVAPTASR